MSIYLFLIGAIVTAILTGTAGVFFVKYLVASRNFNAILSVAGASLTFAIIGVVIDVVLIFAGFFLADAVRNIYLR